MRFSSALAPGAFVAVLVAVGCGAPAKDTTTALDATAAPLAQPDRAPSSMAASYAVVAEKSKIGFVGSKVVGSHSGGFEVFRGSVQLEGVTAIGGSVDVEIDMKSVVSDDEKLSRHLLGADFFDVDNHPMATFKSTKVEAGGSDGATHVISGRLTLRGITKAIDVPAVIVVSGDVVTVKSKLSINRKDFGIEYPGMADNLIQNEVSISLELLLEKR
jgi:polyisoprenoid-binding protein YceI